MGRSYACREAERYIENSQLGTCLGKPERMGFRRNTPSPLNIAVMVLLGKLSPKIAHRIAIHTSRGNNEAFIYATLRLHWS